MRLRRWPVLVIALALAVGSWGAWRSLAAKRAFDLLVEAPTFCVQVPGDLSFGTSETTSAMRTLHAAPGASDAFAALVEQGTSAGKLYGLCGLRTCDPDRFATLAPSFAEETTEVETLIGCNLGPMSPRELVAMIEEGHLPRLLR